MGVSRQILLLSSSTVHGTEYLKYAENEIKSFLKNKNVQRILFIPYALQNHDEYTDKIRSAFVKLGYEVDGIHKTSDPILALNQAQAVYVGGGNTFQLLKSLYDNSLLEPIRKKVLQEGLPYIGSSAGSNVATVSICTTNDMPIVYPPSFKALGLVPFNINPHFLDADPTSKHMGETREERIKQYHELPDVPPVLGLREGCMLHVDGDKATLKGISGAKLFDPSKGASDYEVGSDVSFLLNIQF
ncbi:hypothetical protein R5R35_014634 [Gryllus longicercus]|uniref:dipeptidase E n=2 Tax=Gryllus longicercus TaxID=2509291 RepID=A0AAN9VKU1_9ORTH